MSSIYRNKRNHSEIKESKLNRDFQKISFKNVTHDNLVPRARNYSLNSVLHFTHYSGYTIKEFIETNFNYFTWLPRNIENFTYDKEVLEYAEKCLISLEKIENYPEYKIYSKLGKAINQVNLMLDYEYTLDYKNDESLLQAKKSMINENYYRQIINSPLERLIRLSLEIEQNSAGYRRKYFEEIYSTEK